MQFLCHFSMELNQLSHVSYEWAKNVHGKYVGENVVKYFLDNAQLVTRMTF